VSSINARSLCSRQPPRPPVLELVHPPLHLARILELVLPCCLTRPFFTFNSRSFRRATVSLALTATTILGVTAVRSTALLMVLLAAPPRQLLLMPPLLLLPPPPLLLPPLLLLAPPPPLLLVPPPLPGFVDEAKPRFSRGLRFALG
jgi:hypothetical protein